jgi:DNA repair exonuclease SbcCD ATPase subunit
LHAILFADSASKGLFTEENLMLYVALLAIFLVCIATLIVGLRILQSSRRSVSLGEDRNELLRDQYERLELLREERQVLLKKLEGESWERRRLMEHLEGRTPLKDDQELEQARTESARIAEESEQERLRLEQQLGQLQEELEREQRTHMEAQQKTERLESEHQQLTVDLQNERQERSEAQQRSEQHERELASLEQELQHMKEQPDVQRRGPSPNRSQMRGEPRPLWRRITLVGGLLLVALVVWLTSLMVALSILTP